MAVLQEGALTFDFPDTLGVFKYDDCSFYKKKIGRVGGIKAVDFVVYDSSTRSGYLVEVKDYRNAERQKPSELAEEVATKVLDTLGGLALLQRQDPHTWPEQPLAQQTLRSGDLHAVLHLESAVPPSRYYDPKLSAADVKAKLRSLLKGLGFVTDVQSISRHGGPWTVS